MPATDFSNVTDGFRQSVLMEMQNYFENNAPMYNAFKKNTEKKPLTQKGYRIPVMVQRPGGHTFFVPSASDFNQVTPMQEQSMWVFPTYYALPQLQQGAVMRAFKVDPENSVLTMNQFQAYYTEAATKRIERIFPGDGTGSLAYAATTLSGTGAGQTLTCTVNPATTPGQTKGGAFLELGQTYQAWNATTGAVRGTFTVTTVSMTAPIVTVTSGSITSGDPLTDVGAFQRAPRGMGWLISPTNRDLQGLSTTTYPNFNAPFVDLAGATLTPITFNNAKATLKTKKNDKNAADGLTGFITPGQMAQLLNQGYSLGLYMREDPASDTMKGVQQQYKDGDSTFVEASDLDEDRVYLVKNSAFAIYEEKPFGDYDIDGQDWRMLLGANSTGSDNYQKAIGVAYNLGVKMPNSSILIQRANISGIATQVNSIIA